MPIKWPPLNRAPIISLSLVWFDIFNRFFLVVIHIGVFLFIRSLFNLIKNNHVIVLQLIEGRKNRLLPLLYTATESKCNQKIQKRFNFLNWCKIRNKIIKILHAYCLKNLIFGTVKKLPMEYWLKMIECHGCTIDF